MKTLTLIMTVAFIAGCSSASERKQRFVEGAITCNEVCMNNTEVGEYSQAAGGGVLLLLMGGMEEKCNCNRSQPNNSL